MRIDTDIFSNDASILLPDNEGGHFATPRKHVVTGGAGFDLSAVSRLTSEAMFAQQYKGDRVVFWTKCQ